MRFFLPLTFFIIATQIPSHSQKKYLVLDSLDQKPVDFTFVYCGSISTYSDELGFFYIDCDKNKEIDLSRVGYKQKRILASSLKDTLFLEPINTVGEVTVKEKNRKKRNTLWLGFIEEKTTGTFRAESEAALFINNPYGTLLKINTVKFTFSTTKFLGTKPTNSISYIVRLRIYDMGGQGQPNKDLLPKSITSLVNKHQTSVQFDIEEEGIYLPLNGCFISIEFIGFVDEWKKFAAKNGKSIYNHKIQFTPRFTKGNQKPQSWFRVNGNEPWKKMYDVEGSHPNFKFGVEISR